MTRLFQVWYMRPSFFRDGLMGVDWLRERGQLPDPAALDTTHACLTTIEIAQERIDRALEDLFRRMQGEVWSPNGEARELIRAKGLEHTSMSIGDIAREEATGACWIADRFGFQPLVEAAEEPWSEERERRWSAEHGWGGKAP